MGDIEVDAVDVEGDTEGEGKEGRVGVLVAELEAERIRLAA